MSNEPVNSEQLHQINTGFKPKKSNIVLKKVFAIIVLTIILLIPSAFIISLVSEREQNKYSAQTEMSSKWGSDQKICGPIIFVPIKKNITEKNVTSNSTVAYAKFLPKELNVEGKMTPETRSRGIYKSVFYSSEISVNGEFQITDYSDLDLKSGYLSWNDAFVQIGISDLVGMKDIVELTLNGRTYKLKPGLKNSEFMDEGLSTSISLVESDLSKIEFIYKLSLKGGQSLKFVPIGETTNLTLDSPWSNPSFSGAFLPYERTVTENGFNAKWKVLDLNRNFPQQWSQELNRGFIEESAFGVDLLILVDSYTETMRSVKYMLLFIILTFVVFFLVEITCQIKIHPIQYLLVGISLVLFYLLLLSFSEHLNFAISYLISVILTVSLIGLYSLSVFKGRNFSILVSVKLLILYGFLYVLLRLENYSLLLGSIGLFTVLAVIMYYTRKINWYNVDNS